MTDRDRHAIFRAYPDGPKCQPNCPGPWSEYHDGYADGYEAGKLNVDAELERLHGVTLAAPAPLDVAARNFLAAWPNIRAHPNVADPSEVRALRAALEGSRDERAG